jgi:hypothetical protein
MTVLQKAGDRMLSMFVPRTVAATDNFTKVCIPICQCLNDGSGCYTFFQTCAWKGQPGGPYTCLQCYNGWIRC